MVFRQHGQDSVDGLLRNVPSCDQLGTQRERRDISLLVDKGAGLDRRPLDRRWQVSQDLVTFVHGKNEELQQVVVQRLLYQGTAGAERQQGAVDAAHPERTHGFRGIRGGDDPDLVPGQAIDTNELIHDENEIRVCGTFRDDGFPDQIGGRAYVGALANQEMPVGELPLHHQPDCDGLFELTDTVEPGQGCERVDDSKVDSVCVQSKHVGNGAAYRLDRGVEVLMLVNESRRTWCRKVFRPDQRALGVVGPEYGFAYRVDVCVRSRGAPSSRAPPRRRNLALPSPGRSRDLPAAPRPSLPKSP